MRPSIYSNQKGIAMILLLCLLCFFTLLFCYIEHLCLIQQHLIYTTLERAKLQTMSQALLGDLETHLENSVISRDATLLNSPLSFHEACETIASLQSPWQGCYQTIQIHLTKSNKAPSKNNLFIIRLLLQLNDFSQETEEEMILG